MKKFAAIFGFLLMLGACSAPAVEELKGSSFKMTDKPITINFEETRFFGKAVNNFNGAYEVNGENIKFSAPMSTMMMGVDQEMMKAEFEFFKSLPLVRKFRLENGVLTLIREDGEEIVFERIIK